MEYIGFILAVFVGISLGLIGSGGSILTFPILVYIMHVEPKIATTYSLFIVGLTALVGGIQNIFKKNVDFKSVLMFGIPSLIGVYLTRAFLLPLIPDTIAHFGQFELTKNVLLMCIFAIVMIMASYKMIKGQVVRSENESIHPNRYISMTIQSFMVGVLTGLIGVGGGFLIIPSLMFLSKLPMKRAVGTSLIIIFVNSFFGVLSSYSSQIVMDCRLISYFSLASIAGMFIGILLSKYIDGSKLKISFGWFVLVMGVYIIVREVFLK